MLTVERPEPWGEFHVATARSAGAGRPVLRWLVPMSVTTDGGCQLGSSVLPDFTDSTPPRCPGLPVIMVASRWQRYFPEYGFQDQKSRSCPLPLKQAPRTWHHDIPSLCCKALTGRELQGQDRLKRRAGSDCWGQSTSTENKDKAVIYQKVKFS